MCFVPLRPLGRLAFGGVLLAALVTPARAQWTDSLRSGARSARVAIGATGVDGVRSAVAQRGPTRDSAERLLSRGHIILAVAPLVGAAGTALNFAGVGLAIDNRSCERAHHNDTTNYFLFGPCFIPIARATGIGWYAGAVTGAAIGSVVGAHARGCALKRAIPLALLGTLVGSAPSILYLSRGGDGYSHYGTDLALMTPALQASATTVLLWRCTS